MAIPVSGKHILVTGSTDGLGKELAFKLTKEGAHVILHGRSKEKLLQVEEEIKKIATANMISIVCDLTQPETIQNAFFQVENLDILINNAGVWLEGNTLDAVPEKIIELTKVNLLTPFLITQTLLPKLLKSDFGQILNVVSIAGVEIPAGYYHTIYSGVKFGLQGFTEALAKEFYNKNLRVMGYYSGGMDTNLFKKAGNTYKEHEPWMFNVQQSVEAMLFMLTRDKKVTIKRMDLINQLEG